MIKTVCDAPADANSEPTPQDKANHPSASTSNESTAWAEAEIPSNRSHLCNDCAKRAFAALRRDT